MSPTSDNTLSADDGVSSEADSDGSTHRGEASLFSSGHSLKQDPPDFTPTGPGPGGNAATSSSSGSTFIYAQPGKLSPPPLGGLGGVSSSSLPKSSPPTYGASSSTTSSLVPSPPLPKMSSYLGYPSFLPPDQQSNSFTSTFLRGILTSIDSKDPVVANAWLETLLDAIDLLPPEVVKREIVIIAIAKGQPTQPDASRKSACRLLGKIATRVDQMSVEQDVLPTALALCSDPEAEVRHCMCRHLAFVARGAGLEATRASVLPQLVELSNDSSCHVRLSAIETVVHLLSLLDDETCTQTIVPLVIKSCEQVSTDR